ncbi:MAG: Gfo/Idh/MocA family oxidoreductase [Clostridia bacterium]|nr:Gfo/Idh/MocA family oxidoreductase [Clostridia bacterium]
MLKIGVFGAWRGNSYIDLFKEEEEIEIIAICDKNIDKLIENKDEFANAYLCADFDDFIREGKSRGMSAVFLANYFNEHTPYAIKAMEAGLDVISECTAAGTLAECVELVECVEKTGRRYMLAENYPFSTRNLKMGKIIASGELGTLLYAEGEYNHSGDNAELRKYTPSEFHWRAWMPRTYYVTHALGPIMYMTKSMPKYVSGRAAHSDLLWELRDWRHNYDGVGMMFCEMDNGMIARCTGCTAMASDYSRYRVTGDRAGVEWGGYIPDDKVRRFYFGHTKPEGEEQISLIDADLSEFGEQGEKAARAGHGGGDYWIVQEMKDYFLRDKKPFFDVYAGVAMSAVGILGWRSCLNHGENMKVPDFRIKEERDAVRDDRLTPFPDQSGNGITLPCALPYEEN